MAVDWSAHRFAGGVLALDTANTVVLRIDPARTFDRFHDPAEIARFADAARIFRAEELGGCRLAVPDPAAIRDRVISLREATDRALRRVSEEGVVATELLQPMLASCAEALAGHRVVFGVGRSPVYQGPEVPFEAALAVSALSLLAPERLARIKTCANCGWLFLDSSRNSSRLWCDMAVCGNRQKARRHYHRRKTDAEERHAPA